MLENIQSIRKFLASDLKYDDNQKSSHWISHTANAKVGSETRISDIDGFSSRTSRFPLSSFLHKRAQRKIFSNFDIAIESPFYKIVSDICLDQSRAIDVCVMRHVFTFILLDNYGFLNQSKVACVIGDGQANFVSLAIKSNSFSKIISVNLSEVLLSDLDLIEELDLREEIGLATNVGEFRQMLSDPRTSLILLRATDSHFLTNSQVDLFVNIASFQEMNERLVESYFQIIKSNGSWLYCCNREHKKLYGGEILDFSLYPWGGSETLLDELCPWHKYFYDFRSISLFRRREYDGLIRHRLAKF
jgi:hypothetical protein